MQSSWCRGLLFPQSTQAHLLGFLCFCSCYSSPRHRHRKTLLCHFILFEIFPPSLLSFLPSFFFLHFSFFPSFFFSLHFPPFLPPSIPSSLLSFLLPHCLVPLWIIFSYLLRSDSIKRRTFISLRWICNSHTSLNHRLVPRPPPAS